MRREAAPAVLGSSAEAPPRRDPSIHPYLSAAFAAFDSSGVAWALLRGERNLVEPAGDVDLLVDPADLAAVDAALTEIGFVPERAWGSTHRAYLGYHRVTDAWFKLDIVTSFTFGHLGEVALPGAGPALAQRIRTGSLSVLAPADAFWALLLHCLLDKETFPEKHQGRLEELAVLAGRYDAESQLAQAVADLSSIPAEAIRSAVAEGRWDDVHDFGIRLRGAATNRHPIRSRALRSVRRVMRSLGWRVGLLDGPGITVALLGPDGAGKSTLLAGLRDAFPVPVRGIYMGLYKHHPPLPPGVGLGGRAALQFGRYLRARYHRARGRVVLFDRYTHDALVQHEGASALKLRIHRSVLAHAAPPPDLMIVLDVPGETLHARKGERDPATLEAMRVGYGNIAARVGGPIVDATADIEDVRRAVVALIWSAVAGRRAPKPPGI